MCVADEKEDPNSPTRYYVYQLHHQIRPVDGDENYHLAKQGLIKTGANSAMCGVRLNVNTSYVLGGRIQFNQTQTAEATSLSLNLCGFYAATVLDVRTVNLDEYTRMCQ